MRREALVAQHARGRSFADVGAMWQVEGAIAFAATCMAWAAIRPATRIFSITSDDCTSGPV